MVPRRLRRAGGRGARFASDTYGVEFVVAGETLASVTEKAAEAGLTVDQLADWLVEDLSRRGVLPSRLGD